MVNCFPGQSQGVRNRREAKKEAAESAEALLKTAIERSHTDLDLAKRQAKASRDLLLKFNVRFGYSMKRFTCHGCKRLIVPGVNARVRLSGEGRKALTVTCLECGHVNRKIIRIA